MLSKQQIMAGINLLTEAERGEIVEWCVSLGTKPNRGDVFTEHAFDELSACMSAHYSNDSAERSYSAFTYKQPRAAKMLRSAVEKAHSSIDEWWPTSPRTVKLALLRHICRIAFEVCVRRNPRVDWKHLAGALANTAPTINDAFPGWLRTGEFQRRALRRVSPIARRNEDASTVVVH